MNNETSSQISNTFSDSQPLQPQSMPVSKAFSRLLFYSRIMGAINIAQITLMIISIVLSFSSLNLAIFSSSCLSESEPVDEICYTIGPSIMFMLPTIIIGVIELALSCYAIFLGFNLKNYANTYENLKKHLIILAIISTLSALGLIVVIIDIIVFASLLPKYKKELIQSSQLTPPSINIAN